MSKSRSKKYYKGLTKMQKAFADNFILSGDAWDASKKAGYAITTQKRTNKLLNSEPVKRYIEERIDRMDKKLIASQEEVLAKLTSILRREDQEEIVTFSEHDGDYARTKKAPSTAEVLRAGSELLKRYQWQAYDERAKEKFEVELELLKKKLGEKPEDSVQRVVIVDDEGLLDDKENK